MSSVEQAALTDYVAGSSAIDVTRTIKLPLATSQQKNAVVQAGIDAYQQVASHMADVLPSYPEHEWTGHHSHMYHHAKRALPDDDRQYKTTLAQMAQQDVAEAFASWRELGKPGDRPRGEFGDAQYLQLRQDDCEIVANEQGYGFKASFIAYNPVWFHINAGAYQQDFLARVVDDDDPAGAGSAELHRHGDALVAHQTITWPVDVYDPADVTTTVGVDLNDDPLVAAAVVDGDEVADVLLKSGAEYRHHRERVKRRRAQAMANDNLAAARSARNTYQKYTDHITNVASRRVVDLARKYAPAVIHLEDLTHYRETATDPIHDWPYAEIQTKIASKAAEEGIPIEVVDPRGTSVTCRKCSAENPAARDGREFRCFDCGYEVHADVNAAINIAHAAGTAT